MCRKALRFSMMLLGVLLACAVRGQDECARELFDQDRVTWEGNRAWFLCQVVAARDAVGSERTGLDCRAENAAEGSEGRGGANV